MPRLERKILLVLYEIQDLGGIINWVEHLCHGFKELGASFKLVRIENKEKCVSSVSSRELTTSYAGLPFDQRAGWHFPLSNRVALRSTNWKKYVDQYDLLIWVIPVPSKSKLFEGWKDLYNVSIPQVMVIHDGNLNKLYPHAYSVMDKCTAVACVHDCSYGSVKFNNKHLIPNAQILIRSNCDISARSGVFSLQTFKRWKRVDDLVRAVPFIKEQVTIAGGGIEYYYMTSKTKRKSCYGSIWEEAVSHGMNYLGYISEEERDKRLRKASLLIDPSWSKEYAKYGSHFNRTFIDAVLMGCLPCGRDLLMDGNSFFDPNDYITIPYNATPEEFAFIVNEAISLSVNKRQRMISNLMRVIRNEFNSLTVAAKYLAFCK